MRLLRCLGLLLSAFFPLLAAAEELSLAEQARIQAAIREAGDAVIARGAPGAAISVIYRGHQFLGVFGTDGLNRPITVHTLFEIGSNTKTFTTTLLGLDIARHKARATDKAQDFLPDIELSPEMQGVTLGQLGDFTSSLPDLPPAVRNKPTVQRGLRYFTIEEYFDFIQSWEPQGRLPANYLYSNSSVGLLGYCLVQDTTEDGIEKWYHRVRQEILNPLAMNETTPWPNASQQSRVSAGFFKNGNGAPVWPLQAWAAAGSLRSSVSDLTKYVNAYLGNTLISSKLKRAMQIATKPRYSTTENGDRFDQALAWTIHKVPTELGPKRLILKDGGTAGFSSALAFSREADIGIVVLINKEAQMPAGVTQNLFRNLVNARVVDAVTLAQLSTFNVNYGSQGSYGAVTHVGSGSLMLSGANTYVGSSQVANGTVTLTNGTHTGSGILAIGTIDAGLTIPDGATYVFSGNVLVAESVLKVNDRTVTLNGTARVVVNGGWLDLNGTLYDLTGKTLTIGNGSILLDTENLGAFPPVP